MKNSPDSSKLPDLRAALPILAAIAAVGCGPSKEEIALANSDLDRIQPLIDEFKQMFQEFASTPNENINASCTDPDAVPQGCGVKWNIYHGKPETVQISSHEGGVALYAGTYKTGKTDIDITIPRKGKYCEVNKRLTPDKSRCSRLRGAIIDSNIFTRERLRQALPRGITKRP